MKKLKAREVVRMWIEIENHRQLSYFISLNPSGGHYVQKQKE